MTAPYHNYFMRLALQQAEKAATAGEVPTGCLIIETPPDPDTITAAIKIIGRAHNQTESLNDPTAHAEMIAITQASSALGDFRLTNTTLYVTKEPCAMCAGAIVLARIPLVVFGTPDPRRGGHSLFGILDHPSLIHRAQILGGVLEEPCTHLLTSFFRARRQ